MCSRHLWRRTIFNYSRVLSIQFCNYSSHRGDKTTTYWNAVNMRQRIFGVDGCGRCVSCMRARKTAVGHHLCHNLLVRVLFIVCEQSKRMTLDFYYYWIFLFDMACAPTNFIFDLDRLSAHHPSSELESIRIVSRTKFEMSLTQTMGATAASVCRACGNIDSLHLCKQQT